MALVKIEYGSVASSAMLNDNFNYLDERITDYALGLSTIQSSISSVSTTLNNRMTEQEGSMLTTINNIRIIGDPIFRLSDTIFDDEIRLEGAEVSREDYSELFAIYGITYGEGNGSTTFNLPDLRGRTIWGSDTFGLLEAGLPEISATLDLSRAYYNGASGAISIGSQWTKAETDAHSFINYNRATFKASKSNSIYGNSTTVQPPSIKVRVVTRYK